MTTGSLTILLVEDDRAYRAYAMSALKGHNNICVGSVNDAMLKFTTHKPDITFLDINLPDGNGISLLQDIKSFEPNAFIVMMTGSSNSEDVKKAQEHGASGYILKPFNNKKVQECIDRFLSSR